MDKIKEELRALKESVNAKIDEAIEAAQTGDLEKAKSLQAEAEELKAQIVEKQRELDEVNAIINAEKLPLDDDEPIEKEEIEAAAELAEIRDDLDDDLDEIRTKENEEPEEVEEPTEPQQPETRTRKGNNKMANLNKLKKDNETTEQRAAINAYIKSRGVETRGITTVEAGAVIPEDIVNVPYEKPQTVVDLRDYVNVIPVTTGSGSYPILGKQNARMSTVAELAENPELAEPAFTSVDYKVETYRGSIAISQESIDDAAIDLTGLVAKDVQKQALNTSNHAIAEAVKDLSPKTATSLDDLKTILNTEIDPAYDTKFYMSQSFYNELDKLKDNEGRYLLQPNVAFASGLSVFNREAVILADDVIGDTKGDAVAFVGDLEAAVAFFDRKQVSVKWVDHTIYGQYLAAMVRFDVKAADDEAGFYVTYEAAEPTPTPDPGE